MRRVVLSAFRSLLYLSNESKARGVFYGVLREDYHFVAREKGVVMNGVVGWMEIWLEEGRERGMRGGCLRVLVGGAGISFILAGSVRNISL